MLVCPHCNQEIQDETLQKVPWWRHQPSSKGASLGLGTLMLIALILIVIAGNSGTSQLSQKVDDLTILIEEIHASVPAQRLVD